MFPARLPPPPIDLSHLPPTYLLPAHLSLEKLREIQGKLRACKCPLTDAADDATLFIANVTTQKRSELELRKKDIALVSDGLRAEGPDAKLRPIRVVKLAWLTTSLENGKLEELDGYTILSATAATKPRIRTSSPAGPPTSDTQDRKRKGILERARQDAIEAPVDKRPRYGHRTERERGIESIIQITKRPPLLRQSTSSFEAQTQRNDILPEWIRSKNVYSCCRDTPLESPNDLFIKQLKAIKESRIIGQDETGIRAYATAIAAIKAYPYLLHSTSEIQSIPGCDGKIAGLFAEWYSSSDVPSERTLQAVKELDASHTYQTLRKFYSIWGVGADTAQKFYYTYGFRKLGDIIQHHWSRLSRVQQIGVKYYDEFLTPISRAEVDKIARVITTHAKKVLPGAQSIVVGGYRRGHDMCGDVDVLISHPVDQKLHPDFLMDLLRSLEEAQVITHTLTVSTPKFRHEDPHRPSHSGFDTLDKALLVWQSKPGKLHRRVDIIVAPTVSAGTALLGWTGGTTFERDLRLWCEKEKGWKFSSEGVWKGNERVGGTEGWREGETWPEIEMRVLERIGVGYRDPKMRCTG